MDKSVHYIIGIGRSGSTLLTAILNSHSKIKAIPEIPFSIFFQHSFGSITSSSEELNGLTIEYLENQQRYRPKDLVDLGVDILKESFPDYSSYEEYCQVVYESISVNQKRLAYEVIVDKNPIYSFHSKSLQKHNKSGKFLVLVRDPRAQVLSKRDKQYFSSRDVAFNAFRWRFFQKHIVRIKENSNCKVFLYEALVTDHENIIKDMCSFLNVEFEAALLDYDKIDFSKSEIAAPKTDAFAKEHFSGLNRNVHGAKVDSWKTKLSGKEIKIIDGICSKYASQFGYQAQGKYSAYILLTLSHPIAYAKALYSVYRERLTYYLPIGIKLKRTIKVNRLRKE